MKETTVNIDERMWDEIELTSIELHISKSELVGILLAHMFNRQRRAEMRTRRVKYQKKRKDSEWRDLFLNMEDDIYEKCQDMRRFHKLSVSFVVTIACRLYIKKIKKILKSTNITYNYCSQYISIPQFYDNIFSFTVLWGIPDHDTLARLL